MMVIAKDCSTRFEMRSCIPTVDLGRIRLTWRKSNYRVSNRQPWPASKQTLRHIYTVLLPIIAGKNKAYVPRNKNQFLFSHLLWSKRWIIFWNLETEGTRIDNCLCKTISTFNVITSVKGCDSVASEFQ